MVDEKRIDRAEVVRADAEKAHNDYVNAAIAREEKELALLEQIAKHLESIEHLLHDRLSVKQ